MKIPFYRPYISKDSYETLLSCIQTGQWSTGDQVELLQSHFTKFFGTHNLICTSSATAALEIAIRCLPIRANANIVVPTNTFAATAEVPKRMGHNVIFCDADAKSGNIDTNKLQEILDEVTVDMVIPVHIAGVICDLDHLLSLKEKYGFLIIEDSAQAFGSSRSGIRSDANVFSFYANKLIGSPDGGLLVFNGPQLVDRARLMSLHGIEKASTGVYDIKTLGQKSNMNNISAAMINSQLSEFDMLVERRSDIFKKYCKQLSHVDNIFIESFKENTCYSLFRIQCERRDQLKSYLLDNGVDTSIHFKPLHLHTYWSGTQIRSFELSQSEEYFRRTLSLPFYHELSNDEIKYICDLIIDFYS